MNLCSKNTLTGSEKASTLHHRSVKGPRFSQQNSPHVAAISSPAASAGSWCSSAQRHEEESFLSGPIGNVMGETKSNGQPHGSSSATSSLLGRGPQPGHIFSPTSGLDPLDPSGLAAARFFGVSLRSNTLLRQGHLDPVGS